MNTTRRFLDTATKRTLAALNRADELGGEVRDYLQERIERSETAQRTLARLRRFRGGESQTTSSHAADRAAQKPSTTHEVDKAPPTDGLGDATIAAQIYGRSSCPWTGRSIRLMEDRKIDFDYIDMDEDENARFEPLLMSETEQTTHPWIYVRGTFIGGFDALSESDRLGTLADQTRVAPAADS